MQQDCRVLIGRERVATDVHPRRPRVAKYGLLALHVAHNDIAS